jgi:hypothetical protein
MIRKPRDPIMDAIIASLELIDLHGDIESGTSPRRLLEALSTEISSVLTYIDRVAQDGDGDWWYDEFQVVEDALGMAFVVLQSRMNAIIAQAWRVYSRSGRQKQSNWHQPRFRQYVLELGPSLASIPGVALGCALDTCANYFKHHDEWPRDWDQSGRHAATAKIAKKLGMEPGQVAHSLRTAVQTFGVASPALHDLSPLLTAFAQWSKAVRTQAAAW